MVTTLPVIVVTPNPPAVNVPQVPGVPPINNSGFVGRQQAAAMAILTSDQIVPNIGAGQWGIWLNVTNPAGVNSPFVPTIVTGLNCDSVIGFEFRKDYTLADYPIEGGSFQTYDKAATPFLAKIRVSSGFSPQRRQTLLEVCDQISTTFSSYSVVTPEFIYTSCNVSHYDYRREANRGVGLIVIDIWLTQILVAVTSGLPASGVQNPGSADPINGSVVQLLAPNSQQFNLLNTVNSVG